MSKVVIFQHTSAAESRTKYLMLIWRQHSYCSLSHILSQIQYDYMWGMVWPTSCLTGINSASNPHILQSRLRLNNCNNSSNYFILFPQCACMGALDLSYLGVTIEKCAEGTTGPPATIISTWIHNFKIFSKLTFLMT